MMTTQKQVRAAFWADRPGMFERDYTTRKRQNDYSATIRCEWVDYIDHLARSGEISEALAQRVTL